MINWIIQFFKLFTKDEKISDSERADQVSSTILNNVNNNIFNSMK